MDSIEDRVHKFADLWQDYCLPNKTELIKPEVNVLAEEIDSYLLQTNDNKKEKAKLHYLKGRVLDLIPVYEKTAEELLTKSVKLNPANGDCWNVLAHVLFKKGDYEGASKAIEMAIQTKGKNKVSLRYQSVLLRVQGSKYDSNIELPEEKRKNYDESLKVIKEALLLDMKDWLTWYFLGNAYFSNYIANCKKIEELHNAFKAYNESEKYITMKYPDLYLNRANVEAHLELYEQAVLDLNRAEELDGTLGAKAKIEEIRNRMEYTKNELKKNKIEEIVKTIPNSINKGKSNQEPQFSIESIEKLQEKANVGKMISTKIITKITKESEIPASFLAIDSEGNFLCISIYNVKPETLDQKIKKDSLLTVRDPYVKNVSFEGFTYKSVQAFDFSKIWADKKNFTQEDFNPNTVYNETFEK